MSLNKYRPSVKKGKPGQTLMEMLIALAILGLVAVSFLSGVTNTSKGAFIADEQATAESLARSQMEWVKRLDYSYNGTSYPVGLIPPTRDYFNYTVNITSTALHNPDDGIQKIQISVLHSDKVVFKLEDNKVDR
jgi:prepilin-type N-terminal cleavage/methylation domain-containing protein